MALDQYSYCPCGSGKKIKFCKCADNLQEMLKVERMIEGEQSIAALDRINQLMKTFPSDAWLHAMKCELLLKLREIEPLEEASAKFVRLRPDNPLAQLYRSLLAIMKGNLEEAASIFLQAVADTGETYHPLLPTVALNLITILNRFGKTLPALLHCEYLLDYLGDSSEVLARSYEQIITSEGINILSRDAIPSPSEPEDAPWLERYREAYGLMSRHRIAQAKSKLEAVQREFGPAPEILIAMLHCKLLLLDFAGAAALCGKLADSNDVREEQRIFFQALQYELAPESCGLTSTDEVCQYVIENDSELEAKLIASKMLIPVSNDQMRQMVMSFIKEEVAPKHMFSFAIPIFDGRYPEANPRLTGGWIAYFGRQTDKPPRLIMAESNAGLHASAAPALRAELGLLNREVIEKLNVPYAHHLATQVSIEKPIEEGTQPAFEADLKLLAKDAFLDYRFKPLDLKTPRDVKGDATYVRRLQALLVHWQGFSSTMLSSDDFTEIHQELGIAQPKVDASEDTFDLVGGASYFWTDLETIDAESLIRLMQSAMTRNVMSVFEAYVRRSKTMEWPDNLKLAAEYTSLNMEVRVTRDPNIIEGFLERIFESGKQLGLPVGNAVLERVEVLTHLGRENEAMTFLQKAFKEVPQDPYLQQYLEMVRYEMQQRQMQRGGPDLSNALLRHGVAKATTAAPASSGLWTPDQPSPPPAPKGADESSGSGSKLWIPGQ